MKLSRRIFLSFSGILLASQASAHSFKLGNIAIGHAWALPATSGDGQAFMPLLNSGSSPDALVAARSEICTLVELRLNNRYDDPPAQRFDLPPGKPFPMRPAARHLRLIGLDQPLEEHQNFRMILDFEQAGEIEIEIMVQASATD